MKLCPKCGALMVPTETSSGKIKLCCSVCGYAPRDTKIELKEKLKTDEVPIKTALDKKEIKMAKNTLPIVKEECPKCGNKEAYNWEIQTRAADEPPTQFFRCTKCDHTWREYE